MGGRPYPWSREVWALVLDRLIGAGARLVMFDIIFSATNDGDSAFRAALDRYRDKVVIGANVEFSKLGEQGEGPKIVPPSSSLIPTPEIFYNQVGHSISFPT